MPNKTKMLIERAITQVCDKSTEDAVNTLTDALEALEQEQELGKTVCESVGLIDDNTPLEDAIDAYMEAVN